MKTIIQTLALLALTVSAYAQTFTRKADFPGISRWNTYTFMLGSKLYTGGGLDTNGIFSDFWMYDASANSWTKKANPPFSGRYLAAGVAIAGKGYVGFGLDTSAPYGTAIKDWWQYNDASDTWTQKTFLPGSPRFGTSIVAWNGKGYLVGGSTYINRPGSPSDEHSLKDVWEYNPATDAWTRQPDFTGDARDKSFAQVIGDTLYYGLGQEDSMSVYFSDNFRYNLVAKTWSAMPAIPATTNVPIVDGWSFFSAAYGKKLILLNQDITVTVSSDYQTIYVFNTTDNTWTLYPLTNTTGFRAGGSYAQNGPDTYFGIGTDYNNDVWYKDAWQMRLATFLAILESANPCYQDILVGSAGYQINVTIPKSILQKGRAELWLYSTDGRLLKQFPLNSQSTLDAREFPSAIYTYVILSAGCRIRGGSLPLQ